MGPIDVYLVSKFEAKFEELRDVATLARKADVPRNQPVEHLDLNTTNAEQGSTSMDVVQNIQHSQKTPPDPCASHDFGGMTRIIPSDVNTDADYWLQTEGDVSITDMWKTAPEVQWDEIDFLSEGVGTPRAQNQVPVAVGELQKQGVNMEKP
uniref:Uncharacterized protein n=1 Tax=Arundo donax TaxID=35708 RepID=A0A0A9G6C7_ARUDO